MKYRTRRAGLRPMTRTMLNAMHQLAAAPCNLSIAHPVTINALLRRGWIIALHDQLQITPAGRHAYHIYTSPEYGRGQWVGRTDGICPDCGERPRHTSANGHVYGYCHPCKNARARVYQTRTRADRRRRKLEAILRKSA